MHFNRRVHNELSRVRRVCDGLFTEKQTRLLNADLKQKWAANKWEAKKKMLHFFKKALRTETKESAIIWFNDFKQVLCASSWASMYYYPPPPPNLAITQKEPTSNSTPRAVSATTSSGRFVPPLPSPLRTLTCALTNSNCFSFENRGRRRFGVCPPPPPKWPRYLKMDEG